MVTQHRTAEVTEPVILAGFPAWVSWNLSPDVCVCRTYVKGPPPSHQSWHGFSVWNFGVERWVELQLGSLDTSNCQLLLEREGREGTPMGPGAGGQAGPLMALSQKLQSTLF